MSQLVGYARISTTKQSAAAQLDALLMGKPVHNLLAFQRRSATGY